MQSSGLDVDYNHVDRSGAGVRERGHASNQAPIDDMTSEEETISGEGSELELEANVQETTLIGLRGKAEGKTLQSESASKEETTDGIPAVTRGQRGGQVSKMLHESETKATTASSSFARLSSAGGPTMQGESEDAGSGVDATIRQGTIGGDVSSDLQSVSARSATSSQESEQMRRQRRSTSTCAPPSDDTLRAILLDAEDTAEPEDTGFTVIDESSSSCPADLLQSTSGPVQDRALCPWRNVMHSDANRWV